MRLADLIPAEAETGAGLALQHRGRYLFMLGGPRHAGEGEATFFAGIGGHREEGEDWLTCALREAREELGSEVNIQAAAETTYIGRDLVARPVGVADEPRPLCIYELWNPPEAPWNRRGQGYSYFVVVYAATLSDTVRPHPGDLDAILWLSPEQLARTAEGPLTLQALLDDGAQMECRAQVEGSWTVRPQGTAHALAILLRELGKGSLPHATDLT